MHFHRNFNLHISSKQSKYFKDIEKNRNGFLSVKDFIANLIIIAFHIEKIFRIYKLIGQTEEKGN